MRTTASLVAALMLAIGASAVRAQDAPPGEEPPAGGYGGTPPELEPYGALGAPARRFFTEAPNFRGPGRDDAPPEGLRDVAIGLLVPLRGPDVDVGRRMHQGVMLAVEEANAASGFAQGLPFRLVVRDEAQAWGAAANAAVDMVCDEGVWGILGAVEDANTHVVTRVILKIEVPVVNTAGPDPTLTEHMIPWVVRVRPDDRQTCYALARRIFLEDGHRRVVVFRSNDRYGRMGVRELVDAARRLQHPIALEVRFGEEDPAEWEARVARIAAARPDAVVVWGRAESAGRAAAALRAAGLAQPLYGPDRLCDPAFLAAAGDAAEGLRFTYPFPLDQPGERFTDFRRRYRTRFREEPDAMAAHGYDGARMLLEAIREAGLNRARIRDALFARRTLDGVGAPVRFDVTHNNVTPVVLGRVEGGRFRFD